MIGQRGVVSRCGQSATDGLPLYPRLIRHLYSLYKGKAFQDNELDDFKWNISLGILFIIINNARSQHHNFSIDKLDLVLYLWPKSASNNTLVSTTTRLKLLLYYISKYRTYRKKLFRTIPRQLLTAGTKKNFLTLGRVANNRFSLYRFQPLGLFLVAAQPLSRQTSLWRITPERRVV